MVLPVQNDTPTRTQPPTGLRIHLVPCLCTLPFSPCGFPTHLPPHSPARVYCNRGWNQTDWTCAPYTHCLPPHWCSATPPPRWRPPPPPPTRLCRGRWNTGLPLRLRCQAAGQDLPIYGFTGCAWMRRGVPATATTAPALLRASLRTAAAFPCRVEQTHLRYTRITSTSPTTPPHARNTIPRDTHHTTFLFARHPHQGESRPSNNLTRRQHLAPAPAWQTHGRHRSRLPPRRFPPAHCLPHTMPNRQQFPCLHVLRLDIHVSRLLTANSPLPRGNKRHLTQDAHRDFAFCRAPYPTHTTPFRAAYSSPTVHLVAPYRCPAFFFFLALWLYSRKLPLRGNWRSRHAGGVLVYKQRLQFQYHTGPTPRGAKHQQHLPAGGTAWTGWFRLPFGWFSAYVCPLPPRMHARTVVACSPVSRHHSPGRTGAPPQGAPPPPPTPPHPDNVWFPPQFSTILGPGYFPQGTQGGWDLVVAGLWFVACARSRPPHPCAYHHLPEQAWR